MSIIILPFFIFVLVPACIGAMITCDLLVRLEYTSHRANWEAEHLSVWCGLRRDVSGDCRMLSETSGYKHCPGNGCFPLLIGCSKIRERFALSGGYAFAARFG